MSISKIEFVPLSQVDLAQFCDTSTRAFSDYINGAHVMTVIEAEQMISSQYIDQQKSYIFKSDGRAVGFALVSIRGTSARVASMGFVPESRDKGYGRKLLEFVIEKSREQKFDNLDLEVFEQNVRAHKLYESMGFKNMRRLLGFKKQPDPASSSPQVQPMDLPTAADLCERFDDLDLPWQVSGWRIRQIQGKSQTWHIDKKALIVTSPPKENQISIQSFIVAPEMRRKGLGGRLIEHVSAQYPGVLLKVPQLCPEESASFFLQLGFEKYPLNQVQMRLKL